MDRAYVGSHPPDLLRKHEGWRRSSTPDRRQPHALGASTPPDPSSTREAVLARPDTAPLPPAPLTAFQGPPDARQHLAAVSRPHGPAFDPVSPPEVVQDLVYLGPVEPGFDDKDWAVADLVIFVESDDGLRRTAPHTVWKVC